MKKIIFGLVALIALFGLIGVTNAIGPKSGINYVKVSSCEQVGADVKVSLNNGPKFVLTSTTRDAGHGLRNYKLTCVDSKKYKVEWKEVVGNNSAVIALAASVVKPTATLKMSKSVYYEGYDFVVFEVPAKSDSAIVKTEIFVNGELRFTGKNNSNYSIMTDADVAYFNGPLVNAFAKVYDADGDMTQTNTVTFLVYKDTSSPTATLTGKRSGSDVELTVNALEKETVIRKIEVYFKTSLGGSLAFSQTYFGNDKNVSKTFSGHYYDFPGALSFYAIVYDMAGNKVQTNVVNLYN